jgi:ribosome-associated protein
VEGESIRLGPNVVVHAAKLVFTQARSGGAGGQNVNKTESKAELRVHPADIDGLNDGARRRLVEACAGRLDADGAILIHSDETRSLRTNKDLALDRLRDLVLAALVVPKRRKKTRPGRGAIERRLDAKSRNSDRKRDRRVDE